MRLDGRSHLLDRDAAIDVLLSEASSKGGTHPSLRSDAGALGAAAVVVGGQRAVATA